MIEQKLENRFVREVKKCGGLALKFTTPSLSGMPDRLVLFPDGRLAFVEMKAPGKKPRPLQKKRINDLREMGFTVYVIDSEEGISEFIKGELL